MLRAASLTPLIVLECLSFIPLSSSSYTKNKCAVLTPTLFLHPEILMEWLHAKPMEKWPTSIVFFLNHTGGIILYHTLSRFSSSALWGLGEATRGLFCHKSLGIWEGFNPIQPYIESFLVESILRTLGDWPAHYMNRCHWQGNDPRRPMFYPALWIMSIYHIPYLLLIQHCPTWSEGESFTLNPSSLHFPH